MRLTMVGAANMVTPDQARHSEKISSGSKAPDSGTTFSAACATCGGIYRPEPCDIGAACSRQSPGAMASTSEK